MNLLILYEMAEKAKHVIDRKTYAEFKKWAIEAVLTYKDAVIERQANIYLFKFKDQYGF